jgi:hypothetical protein
LGGVIIEHGEERGVVVDPLGDGRRPGNHRPGSAPGVTDQRTGDDPAPRGDQGRRRAGQVEELAEQRAADAGDVPADGGLAGWLAGAAEHDQLVPFDAGVRAERQFQADVDPAAVADDERTGVGDEVGAFGQVGADV